MEQAAEDCRDGLDGWGRRDANLLLEAEKSRNQMDTAFVARFSSAQATEKKEEKLFLT